MDRSTWLSAAKWTIMFILNFETICFDLFVIQNIAALEKIVFPAEFLFNVGQVQEVAGIGQFVVIDDRAREVGFFKNISDKIGPDKAGSAGHQDICRSRDQVRSSIYYYCCYS